MNTDRKYRAVLTSRLLAACLLLLSSGVAWSLELAEVLANTAVTPPAQVKFREERHNRMLKEPIVSTGYLAYTGPGHLRKVVETPVEESFLIADGKIEIVQDGKTRRLSLGRSKPLQAMLGGIEAILAGRPGPLNDSFEIELTGVSDDWKLRMVPRSSKISAQLMDMQVQGNAHTVCTIRIDMKDGEWSLMKILPAEAKPLE